MSAPAFAAGILVDRITPAFKQLARQAAGHASLSRAKPLASASVALPSASASLPGHGSEKDGKRRAPRSTAWKLLSSLNQDSSGSRRLGRLPRRRCFHHPDPDGRQAGSVNDPGAKPRSRIAINCPASERTGR